jgi:two-component sensor histidine kinase
VWYYLDIGDSLYAKNSCNQDFIDASYYYDTAFVIAQQTKDDTAIANAYLAKGRLYDAWKKDADKTIFNYSKASEIYKKIKLDRACAYAAGLAIHAMADKGDTVATLNAIQDLIKDKSEDTLRKYNNLIALVSSEAVKVKAFDVATKLLGYITVTQLVTEPINYKHKYYEAQFDMFCALHPSKPNPFLDSFLLTIQSKSPFDSAVVQLKVYKYYKHLGQYAASLKAYETHIAISENLSTSESNTSFSKRLSEIEQKELEYKGLLAYKDKIIKWVVFAIIGIVLIASLWLTFNTNKLRKRTEQYNLDLQDKLTEIQLLNQEMHHRIKNNIYMVYSMLKMQEKQATSTEQKQLIAETTNRINSMALMHEELFLKQSTKESLNNYLAKVIKMVSEQFSHQKNLSVNTNIDQVSLPNKDILPLGLLINELLTNSIKYAIPEDDKILQLNLRIFTQDSNIFLEYFDNGKNLENPAKQGLGTRLIELLTKQLKAERIHISGSAFHYKLKLKHEPSL